jgi:hypothetical protein
MNRIVSCCLALLAFAAPVRTQNSTPTATTVLVLEHASLIDGRSDAVRSNVTIVIRGSEIAEVRSTPLPAMPDNSFVLDVAGAWVIPGLVDSHVHVSEDSRKAIEDALERALRGGVTTVRDMAGDARQLAGLQRDALLGAILSPDIVYSALFAGAEFFTDPRAVDVTRGAVPGEVAWARAVRPGTDLMAAALEAKGAGASAVKIYADLPPNGSRACRRRRACPGTTGVEPRNGLPEPAVRRARCGRRRDLPRQLALLADHEGGTARVRTTPRCRAARFWRCLVTRAGDALRRDEAPRHDSRCHAVHFEGTG